jgi:TP901 family phage tail tape measure protein
VDRNLRIRMLLEAGDRVSKPLRDIAAGSGRAAQALRVTRDRLREIDRAQGDVAAFRQLKAGLRSSEQAMQTAQTRATELGRAVAQAGAPTRALARDFERAKREADQLTRQHQAETRELDQLRDRLRAAGVATGDLARHERDLRSEASRLNGELGEQERRLRTVTDRQRRMTDARERFSRISGAATGIAASGAAALGTGMAMTRPLVDAVKVAQDFESGMTDIAQKANLGRDAASGMAKNLLAAARAANQLPEDLRAGVDVLAGFGLKPQEAVRMMTPIGRAATAYKAEIADLSAAAFAAHDNLKVPIEQTAKMIDVMAHAGKAGAFEVKDMAQHFPALTAAYQGLGQKGVGAGADIAAALQITRKGAGDSATAANNLANVLQKINAPATTRAFEKMGVDSGAALKKLYAEGKTPIEAIAELTNRTLKGDLSKLGLLFEDAQVQAGLRPLIQNMEQYRKIRAEAGAASGTTDGDFAERLKDSAQQSKRFAVNTQVLAATLGGLLLPTVNAVLTKVNAFANWVGDAAQRNPLLAKSLAIGAAAFAALFLVIGGGALVVAGLVAPFAALSFAAGALGVGLLPVIGIAAAVVAGVVLLGAAAYYVYAKWEAIKGWFVGVWNSLRASTSGGVQGISDMLLNWSPLGILYRSFATVMRYLGFDVPAKMSDAGRAIIQGLIRGITGMLSALKSTIVNAASAAAGWFKSKLGIRSPSRVFMGFGGHIVDGLAIGIGARERAPVQRLERLSRRMTAAIAAGAVAAPAFAGGGGGAPGSGSNASRPSLAAAPITIQIYGAPGQSEQRIAEEVRRVLEQERRGEAAARQSSFADRPDWE